MKTSTWLKIILKTFEIISDRGLVLQLFEAIMNLASMDVLCIFGNQYIMGRVLSCSVILRPNFLQYFMLVLMILSLDSCVCEYVEFLFLFGDTSANTLEMQYFLHINTNLFDALSEVIITNFPWISSRCFLTSGWLSTGFFI